METLKVIVSPSKNPYFNLSLEEWALTNLDVGKTSYLLLYVNEPAVVVGRNQNIFEEINIKYCLDNNIKICRRISGGGTVFHDLGNLNWAIVTQQSIKKVNDYKWAVKPLFKVLKSLQLEPYLTPRNAIEVNGLKISGQAQFTKKKAMISHGTLLIDSALDIMQPSIESPYQSNIVSKSSKSVRSKVVNLNRLLKEKITINHFQLLLANKYPVHYIDFDEINTEKLSNDKWVFERSPKFEVSHFVDNQNLLFKIEKAKVVSVSHKNGQPVKNCPYINLNYKDFVLNY